MKSWLKRKAIKWGLIGGSLFFVIFFVLQIAMGLFAAVSGGNGNDCGDTVEASANTESGFGGGDWTKKGSQGYKNAKAIFDYWTKKRGFSGAAAAGVVGNAGNESHFDPFVVQIGSESYLQHGARVKNAALINGPTGTNGYGLFQISPGSKLAKWSGYSVTDDEAEASTIQMDYFWNAYGGASISNGIKNSGHKIKIGTSGSVEEGTWNWFYYVELSAGSQSNYDKKANREAIAQKAYELFDGASIKADTKKLGKPVSGGSETAEYDDSLDEDTCEILPDGEGSVGELSSTEWKDYSDLPKQIKKYAHDPEELLGSRGNGTVWKQMGVSAVSEDQCVGLTVAYGNKIWGTSGNKYGNGIDQANSWAKATKTTVGGIPKAGSIASLDGFGGNPAGHTFIVQHVFEDGSLLVVEQNWSLSGQNAHEKFTWDFRIVTRKEYTRDHAKFTYPGANSKYHLNWG